MSSPWKAQPQQMNDPSQDCKVIGSVELQGMDGEWHHFHIIQNDTHLIFGGVCNTGLLESGNYKMDLDSSTDENLQELVADLECFYNDCPESTSDNFSYNDRM